MSQTLVDHTPPSAALFPVWDLSATEPIRAELCGIDHLEAHAREVARSSRLAPPSQPGKPFQRRLLTAEQELVDAHARIVEASRRQQALTPDAEWLLDNFHIIEEALREVRQDLPGRYYEELPKLADGPYGGWPRVLALAVELVAHTDSSLDENSCTRFVQAYQSVTPLRIGELWAVPILLRIGLLENLRRLALQVVSTWEERRVAERLAATLSGEGRPDRVPKEWSDSCIVHLMQVLRDQGPEGTGPLDWLERCLAGQGRSCPVLLRGEHQRQAANQVSVGNCVTSLRLLSNLDWSAFFERTSVVEAELRTDPADVYTWQDFATRDRYRRRVERLARGSSLSELEVARAAVAKARAERGEGSEPPPAAHVGHHLIGPGKAALEAGLHYRPPLGEALLGWVLTHPGLIYFGSLAAVTALAAGGILAWVHAAGAGSWPWLLLAAAVVLLPASDLAVALVHHLVTLLLPPRVLPRFDFKDGIPEDCATFVVVPTLMSRPEGVARLVDRLEVHYLSNPDPQLRFALLTDFADAPAEHQPGDGALLQTALEKIRALNERYAGGAPDRFFLLHRRRLWNPAQGCWMGRERKRGKLGEFNRLLRGAADTSFTTVSGDLAALPTIRYVITLDSDTQLPREAASRLVATLAHPLNRPRYDPTAGRVVEGHAVLQPRVSLSLLAGTRSRFARILAGSAGLDPYTTAVSDVYQDLFGRGTYTGKGIYDVDAFEAAVGHTFPDNHILSHDLIEGNYARCALVTDVELVDDFPAAYHAYARREHRWARGDWQILPWVLPSVPVPRAGSAQPQAAAAPAADPGRSEPHDLKPNPLPALERWKVFDNLRRSLVPPALVLLLALGWAVLPGSPWLWSALALLVLAMPVVLLPLGAAVGLARGGRWRPGELRLQWNDLRGSLAHTAGQALLSATFLALQALTLADATLRTLHRLYVSRRHLLEWETASATERRLGTTLLSFYALMWPATALAVALAGLVGWARPEALPAAAPFLLAWLFSPAVAWFVSRARVAAVPPLTAEERGDLRRVARKTWHFFDTFVTAEDHWLPPDNYQEDPKGKVAHRTSPTNLGLYLLSSLAAHDLGYQTLTELAGRLEQTLDTFDRLERFHGHFQNWYDTTTLAVLNPPYVSTVDSGNLLGCLLALKQGLLDKAQAPLDLGVARLGLLDTLRLAREALTAVEPRADPAGVFAGAEAALAGVEAALASDPADLLTGALWLHGLERQAELARRRVQALVQAMGAPADELTAWVGQLARRASACRAELLALAPWLALVRPGQEVQTAGGPGPAGSGAEVQERWGKVYRLLATPAGLADQESRCRELLGGLSHLQALDLTPESRELLGQLTAAVGRSAAPALLARLGKLGGRAQEFAAAMDFKMLYNAQRHLFSIGYNRQAERLDQSHYDLLASESALTSFLAVARGDVPRKHWFQLGRQLTRAGGGLALLSWGGTLFEYLMPRLLLRAYPGTLLDESARGAVARQIEYGRQSRVPWGVSESGFNALDASLDYQYQSFGVPGLGLKRGLSRDLVIAPYATGLAVMVEPRAAGANFRALAAEKAEGPYGFYEAIDYTHDRLRERRRSAVVRSYMAHHQGMTLVALTNALLGAPMVRRFHAEPMVRATELLLQERLPRVAPLLEANSDEAEPAAPLVRDAVLPVSRRLTTAQAPHPRTHLLSNGTCAVMLTSAGAGYSTYRDLDVTRWREDRTTDSWGQWCYLRDLRTHKLWSATHQPLGRPADSYEVIFATDKAEFRRRDAQVETYLEVTVSPEHAAEVRRLTLTNHGARPADLECTSYAEVVLLGRRADLAHPAFGKLFLETEWLPGPQALLCRRRPRSPEQQPVYAVHVLAADGPLDAPVEYESDRARFLGRGRTPANPAALDRGAALSGTTGPVLDPVFSLRARVRLAPGSSASVAFTTAVAATREEAVALADRYRDSRAVTRAFELAWAHTQVQLRHLHLSAEEAHLFQRLAAHVLYAGPALRAAPAVLRANRQGAAGLWRHGISGDRPIVLARLAEGEELPLARQALLAHAYWRLQGLEVDLVLLNEHASGYQEELQEQLQTAVRSSDSHGLIDRPGGVFLRKADHLSEGDRTLLLAAARVVLTGWQGTLTAQVDRPERPAELPAALRAGQWPPVAPPGSAPSLDGLRFANGLGGFSGDGTEYVVALPGGAGKSASLPPAPWINVVANPNAGFLVSEGGGGYTWAGNSQTNRLTPWNNDPVSDAPGEVLYLRDDASGAAWTPTPLPLGGPCRVRHGYGYTVFESWGPGLATELTLAVAAADPVKLLLLKVRNTGDRPRRLSATFYAEWVLGTARDQAPMQVLTELRRSEGTLLAHNPFNADFPNAVAFAAASETPHGATADRTEFLGRNGSVAAPAALRRAGLSGRAGPGLDPCAALTAPLELAPGEEKEIVFVLGEGPSAEEALRLAGHYRDPARARAALEEARANWRRVLGTLQVQTPYQELNLLVNGWLLYQVLSCRVWGRSALYQSGGAYGFRDQLQDVLALAYAKPDEARAQILRAAARQFPEGDVQHWWHPPLGRGVRTRISDDLLWLPYAVAEYVAVTGDESVLGEPVPFLRGPQLKPDQEEDYGQPQPTEETAAVYDHCARAIEHALRYGEHGLPLMGTGDWNDGMNRVGAGGKGESVWNAWFLLAVLPRWRALAGRRGDAARAERYRQEAEKLRLAAEAAWDGGWYRRAYFDDGTPLGSAGNEECQIDSIAQSWAVLSGAGDPGRARAALQAVEERLVDREARLIRLFAPPFDRGHLEPGYIKGYVPGIRENGGQYTHAAAWAALAAARLGQGTRAVTWFDLLNPVRHAATPEQVGRYKVEPYVVAADVYGEPPHTGRGGWTWYTGSAGWMYRVAVEGLLGFHKEGDRLRIDPCIPPDWPYLELTYRHGSATYHIVVEDQACVERGVKAVTLDGNPVADGAVPLADDGGRHEVRVVMG